MLTLRRRRLLVERRVIKLLPYGGQIETNRFCFNRVVFSGICDSNMARRAWNNIGRSYINRD